jgi:hypothetical protein
MALRGRLRRLERATEQDMISIPQTGGTVKKFPASEGLDAFLSGMSRLRAQHLGDEIPPEHPLTTAAINSSDAKWRESFFALTPNPEVKPDEASPGQDPPRS